MSMASQSPEYGESRGSIPGKERHFFSNVIHFLIYYEWLMNEWMNELLNPTSYIQYNTIYADNNVTGIGKNFDPRTGNHSI